MNYLLQVDTLISEAKQTGKVLLVGSPEELKLVKPFCKLAKVKCHFSRRVLPGKPQLWKSSTNPE